MFKYTIGELIKEKAEKYPNNDAVVYPHQDIRWSYSEFYQKCVAAAKGLTALGVKKGDNVAVWATNVPEWLIMQFATGIIGAVLVTVNTNYKVFELEYLLKQSDSTTLIMSKGFKDSNYIEYVNKLCKTLAYSEPGSLAEPHLPYLKNIIYIGEDRQSGMFLFDDLYNIGMEIPDERVYEIEKTLNCNEVVNMQYTSGTTGFPKGVMLTHANIINNGYSIGECMKLSDIDRLCIPVPLFHCFGCVLGVLACVTHASAMVVLDHFNPIKVMQAVQKEKCTALHGVPTMFISILRNEDFDNYDFSSLRTGIMAGSPCPVEVMKKVVEKMNMNEITIAYGQTEASPVITQTRVEDSIDIRVSTVGKALPGIEAKIIEPETGEDVNPNVQGELVARGYNVMKGYYNMPEATKDAIDDEGWLHTGDLATMDENGYFKITGRLKDMIIRGGENIYPREIEEFLYTHPKISDVQVVGVPDEKYGEEVIAFIVLKENENPPTEKEIIEFVKKGLSTYKCPRYVKFIKSYPVTASGKIQKYKLRQMAIDDLNLQDAASIETA